MNKGKSKSTNICIFRSEKNSIIEKSEKEEDDGEYEMKGCVSALLWQRFILLSSLGVILEAWQQF